MLTFTEWAKRNKLSLETVDFNPGRVGAKLVRGTGVAPADGGGVALQFQTEDGQIGKSTQIEPGGARFIQKDENGLETWAIKTQNKLYHAVMARDVAQKLVSYVFKGQQ